MKITSNPVSSLGPLVEGVDSATLTCEAKSIPRPDIQWFRVVNGGQPQQVTITANIAVNVTEVDTFVSRGSLEFMVVGAEDFGEYFCRASNSFATIDSSTATLILGGM